MPSESTEPDASANPPRKSGDTATDTSAPKVKDFVEDHIHEVQPIASGSNSITANGAANGQDAKTRKPARGPEPFDQSEREEMEHLLEELRGHLGTYCLTEHYNLACVFMNV